MVRLDIVRRIVTTEEWGFIGVAGVHLSLQESSRGGKEERLEITVALYLHHPARTISVAPSITNF